MTRVALLTAALIALIAALAGAVYWLFRGVDV